MATAELIRDNMRLVEGIRGNRYVYGVRITGIADGSESQALQALANLPDSPPGTLSGVKVSQGVQRFINPSTALGFVVYEQSFGTNATPRNSFTAISARLGSRPSREIPAFQSRSVTLDDGSTSQVYDVRPIERPRPLTTTAESAWVTTSDLPAIRQAINAYLGKFAVFASGGVDLGFTPVGGDTPPGFRQFVGVQANEDRNGSVLVRYYFQSMGLVLPIAAGSLGPNYPHEDIDGVTSGQGYAWHRDGSGVPQVSVTNLWEQHGLFPTQTGGGLGGSSESDLSVLPGLS